MEHERIITADPLAARRRNRRKLGLIVGLAVIVGAIGVGMLLIPSLDIIDGQVRAETTPVNRAQPLAEPAFVAGTEDLLSGNPTDAQTIVAARDARSFDGPILLQNVEVQTVPGDEVFSVGMTPANSVLVKIDEGRNERAVSIRPGQRINLSGTVEEIGSLGRLQKEFGVSGPEAGRLGNSTLYIRARAVQVIN